MDTQKPQSRFIQESPQIGNQFLEDSALLDYMHFLIPQEVIQQAQPDLVSLGHRVITEIQDYARDAERNQPKLEQFDAWGNRIDVIHTTSGWKSLKRVSAEEGIVAFAYENHYGVYRRLLQIIRLYLFAPSSGLYNCPLAMTDGVAFMFKNMLAKEGDKLDPVIKEKLQDAFSHLTSRDPQKFWTSGQWMTERRGGSDVSGSTETVGVHQKGFDYKLYGDKWFTSATDSEMCVTLARVKANSQVEEGDRKIPLSLFFMKIRNDQGALNGIQIRKLKDKLGTRELPTAELELHGSDATLLSPPGRGVKYISDVLNITRLYNSVAAVGAMRRMIALARDWSHRRTAWGKKVSDLPLQNQVLMQMELTFRGSLLFTLSMANLLGKIEEGKADSNEENLFRILIPVLKLFTAKEGVKVCSEGIECFGGQGYIESTGIPVIFRDAHVTTIWEGTTNVLCYDFIRGLGLGKIDRLESFGRFFRESIGKIMQSDSNLTSTYKEFREAGLSLIESFNELYSDLHTIVTNPKSLPSYESNLREITFGIARIYIGVQLGLCATRSGNTKDVYLFVKWFTQYAPYKKFLYGKGKLELSSQLLKDVAMDKDSKERHEYLTKDVAPHLLIRPKF